MRKKILSFFILIPIIVNAQSETSVKDTINGVFISVEEMPEYSGGEKALWKFIDENLEYPSEAKKNRIKGKIRIKFTVDIDGSLKDFKIISKNKLGYGCEEAAMEVLKKMPKWKPGKQNGQPVAVYFNIPFRFPPRKH